MGKIILKAMRVVASIVLAIIVFYATFIVVASCRIELTHEKMMMQLEKETK